MKQFLSLVAITVLMAVQSHGQTCMAPPSGTMAGWWGENSAKSDGGPIWLIGWHDPPVSIAFCKIGS